MTPPLTEPSAASEQGVPGAASCPRCAATGAELERVVGENTALHAELRRLHERIAVLETRLGAAMQAQTTAAGDASSTLPTEADIASARMESLDPAHAWTGGDVTFEEKIAAKAFFRDDEAEEPSRRWLLGD